MPWWWCGPALLPATGRRQLPRKLGAELTQQASERGRERSRCCHCATDRFRRSLLESRSPTAPAVDRGCPALANAAQPAAGPRHRGGGEHTPHAGQAHADTQCVQQKELLAAGCASADSVAALHCEEPGLPRAQFILILGRWSSLVCAFSDASCSSQRSASPATDRS
jgi:hypothetical protein